MLLPEGKRIIKRQLYSGPFTLKEKQPLLSSNFYGEGLIRNEATMSHVLEFSVREVQMLLSLVEAKSRRRS